MKQILIAGSGFAGISCALSLHKKLGKNSDVQITLVDRHPYHLSNAYLYEVAASPEELTTISQLKQSIAVSIADVIASTKIKFHQGEITKIDPDGKQVQLQHGTLNYDYLVLAMGSTSNYYGIPGAEKYSIPLKQLRDSFAIRNKIQFLLDTHRMDTTKSVIRMVVAGGGFAGVEMAAELKGLLDFLSWKENYPRHKLEVAIIEGSGQLMPGMGERIGRDMYDRLKSLGVQVRLNSLITNIDEQFLELKNGEKLSYDSLIWTAGVRAREMPFVDGVKVESDKTGRIMVNPMLQIENYRNISVIGDGTCFMGTDGKPLPGTARHAIDQGKYVAYALTQVMQNKKPQPYSCKNFGYIVTAGGKWAIFQTKRFYMKGFLPYLFRQIGWLHYFYTILGLRRAIRLIILENRLYGRND